MKTPRVKDFDPNTAIPQLVSPLDKMPTIQSSASRPLEVVEEMAAMADTLPDQLSTKERPSVRPFVRTSVRRTTTRYSFEFFRDQIESLKRFSLEEQTRGERGSMSQMVREAVDMYIAKRNRTDSG